MMEKWPRDFKKQTNRNVSNSMFDCLCCYSNRVEGDTDYIFCGPILKHNHTLRCWRLGRQPMNLGGGCGHSSIPPNVYGSNCDKAHVTRTRLCKEKLPNPSAGGQVALPPRWWQACPWTVPQGLVAEPPPKPLSEGVPAGTPARWKAQSHTEQATCEARRRSRQVGCKERWASYSTRGDFALRI